VRQFDRVVPIVIGIASAILTARKCLRVIDPSRNKIVLTLHMRMSGNVRFCPVAGACFLAKSLSGIGIVFDAHIIPDMPAGLADCLRYGCPVLSGNVRLPEQVFS
jgi:hypothetical protein